MRRGVGVFFFFRRVVRVVMVFRTPKTRAFAIDDGRCRRDVSRARRSVTTRTRTRARRSTHARASARAHGSMRALKALTRARANASAAFASRASFASSSSSSLSSSAAAAKGERANDRAMRPSDASASASALTDTFGRAHTYLRVSLTERCNLRCVYCMPEDGVKLTPSEDLLSADEVERLVSVFARAGVNKVRLTGGEPTVRSDLEDIVKRVAAVPGIVDVSMTTNGVTLGKRLETLKANGLTRLNISLDTLVPAKFEFMTRRKGQERVVASIDKAIELGFQSVKVNCVVMRGQNDDELLDFVALTKNKPINVRFIEYMPFDGNKWSTKKVVSYVEMKSRIEEKYGALVRRDDAPEEVAKNFSVDGHVGSVSFVTSMTNSFCAGCNRLRIMADGNLKVCLFGNSEVSLRDAMRRGDTNDDLLDVIGAAVRRKKAAHAGMDELARLDNRAMIKIGG